MDLTIEDVKTIALELWLAQRESTRLRQDNRALVVQLEQLGQSDPTAAAEVPPEPEGSKPCRSPQETCPTQPPPPQQ